MYNCEFCGKSFESKGGNTRHMKYCHLNPNAVECKTGHIAWNKGQTASTDERIAKGVKTRKDNINNGKITIIGHPHSAETKALLSEKRKQYLKDNPDKHVWKRATKFKSAPCEFLKEKLRSLNINFIEEYSPFTDCAIALDIAFPDILLGIEVNGNQHYNADGSLKDYYQARHNKLVNAGWTIYEIHYTLCYNINNFDDILKLDIYNKDYVGKYFSNKEFKQKEKINKKKAHKIKIKKVQDDKLAFIEARKQIIINSDIDFTKFGWVNKISKLINIKPQPAARWIKKYMPEFYENCFKKR